MSKKQLILVLVAILGIGAITAGGVVYFLGGSSAPTGGTVTQLAKGKGLVRHDSTRPDVAKNSKDTAGTGGVKKDTAVVVAAAVKNDSGTVATTATTAKDTAKVLAGVQRAGLDTMQLKADGLIKILNTMDAKHVAGALALLSDSELRSVLGRLNARQASAVMTLLPVERVANLTRLALGHPVAAPIALARPVAKMDSSRGKTPSTGGAQ